MAKHKYPYTSVKQSISARLISVVFTIYLLVAIIVTCFHLFAEYVETKNNLFQELIVLQKTFEPGIARTMWYLDYNLLETEMRGILQHPFIIGERVIDTQGSGFIIGQTSEQQKPNNDWKKVQHITETQRLQSTLQSKKLIAHQFTLMHIAEDGEQYKVGEMTLYSSYSLILQRLEWKFFIILIASLIKTAALLIIFLWVGKRLLSRPLEKLTQGLKQLDFDRLEQFHVSIDSQDRNELKLMEEAFNTMVHKLVDSRKQLYDYANELQNNRKQLQSILDNASALIFLKDINSQYILINHHFSSTFQVSSKDIIGKTDYDIFPADIADSFVKNDQKVIRNNAPIQLEEYAPLTDGIHTYLSVKFPLYDTSGKFYAICGIATDISERKKLENLLKNYNQMLSDEVEERTRELQIAKDEALRAKEIAEQATLAKSSFLANMSHEIRTPLNPIVSLTYLALQADPPDVIRDYLYRIQSSSKLLLSIINDVLDFSKIEAGQIRLENIPFSLDEVINTLLNLYTVKASEKELDFKINIAPELPRNLIGDSLRLEQVLCNLISNAIKFTQKGTVIVDIETIEQLNHTLRLRFSISDTGIGMTETQIDSVFQMFSQADSSTTRKYGGTGLGLAICQRLVSLMGGKISLISEPGKGSCFSFILEFGLSQHEEIDNSALSLAYKESPESLKGSQILVVDDNWTNQMVTQELLKSEGYSVTIANNGLEAVAVIKQKEFDLVLMDIQMPEMDGLEATIMIRKDKQFNKLPIIAMTANAMTEDRQNCLDAGMNDHIAKPIDPDQLYEKLSHWLKSGIKV